MRPDWFAMLFPESPRDFPGRRLLRSMLRAVHILGGGMLIAAFHYAQSDTEIMLWVAIAGLSGLILLITDLYASFAVLLEWRGLAMMAKIGGLLLLPVADGFEIALLVGILVTGSVSSHLSRKFRHRTWLKVPRVTVDTRRG